MAKHCNRPDIPRDMWVYDTLDKVKAFAGVAAVLKKDGVSQRNAVVLLAAGGDAATAHLHFANTAAQT